MEIIKRIAWVVMKMVGFFLIMNLILPVLYFICTGNNLVDDLLQLEDKLFYSKSKTIADPERSA